MKASKIFRVILLAMVIGIGGVIADWLIGWRPRFGLEADFQRVINEAQVADYYRGSEGGGWDEEDVTDKICDRVDRSILNDLGLPVDDRTRWRFPVNGTIDKPQDIWTIHQDKGAIAACRDRSARFLKIGIDRHTSVCSAWVSVMPNCDL